MDKVKDNLIQKENSKWEFNKEVADCFEDMLSRSIPQYDIMRNTVTDLAMSILKGKDSFFCLDLGCSNGLMIQKLWQPNGHYLGVDVSIPMLEKAKETFKDKENVLLAYMDLRTDFPFSGSGYDCITSILSIMFTPIEYRQSIIQRIYDNLKPGGVFFFVEKVLGNDAFLNELFVKNYYAMKSANGYSEEQIERKRLSLEGVQVCVTSNWNLELLKQAGFRKIDTFWRWCNFEGMIAIK